MVDEGREITKDEAKDKIRKLANSFSNTPANDLDKKSEEQIKFQFIEPLFEALGWQKEDIEKEQRVLKGRADYILKIGNQEVMVIEAKRTNVSLDEEEGRQAVSYAYHRKIKFAVLTNFKQIRVYHALSNIKNINKNLLRDDKGYLVLNSYDFVNEFERLRILSRESFERGEINKLLSAKDEKVSKPIDESILEDLLQFRDGLSKDLKKLRMTLSDDSIDEIVQILIDRLIFMRSVEDRGLEDKDLLLKLIKDTEQGRTEKVLWGLLKDTFKAFDKTYNSKLFAEGLLEKEGFFDEDILKKVINGLYFGTKDNRERYMFDEIPGDLLGNIYEQYLGTVLRGSDKRVKLEEGTGKRKKMGIYYTPSYIVDYIVKNTVGEYIQNKTIDEILDTRIVDPACGSGSFLIRAFREVCDIVEKKLAKGERSGKWLMFKNYKGRLSLGQKMDILRNCIYGVDLDEKAVELAQLNLLLRLLEDETKETRKQLPTLKDNIKCGNSLIDDLAVSDKAFSWRAQFPKVFAQGGFDVVVGNPPYVDYSKIGGTEYLNNTYESTKMGNGIVKYNLFQLFIEKSTDLLKNGGRFGFINPNTYLSAENAYPLRKVLLDKVSLKKIVDVSHLSIFKEASTYPVITIFEKGISKDNMVEVGIVSEEKDITPALKLQKINQDDFKKDDGLNFIIGGNRGNKKVILKLESFTRLNELKDVFVWGSSITGFAKHKRVNKENGAAEPVIQTRDIKRYFIEWKNEYIEKSIYSDKLVNLFKQRKIVIARVTKGIQATIDEDGFFVGKSSILILKDKTLFEYLLAIINSKLINFYYKLKFETTHMAGGYLRFDIPYLSSIPIKLGSVQEQKKITDLVIQMLALQKKLCAGNIAGREKERLEQQIKQVDFEIDQEVYKIYGITEEEKKVIEESLK